MIPTKEPIMTGTGPFIVTHRQPCEDCHGIGERHPTTRGYMSHEVRDCETCARRGDTIIHRETFATLEECPRVSFVLAASGDRVPVVECESGDERRTVGQWRVPERGGEIEQPDHSVLSFELAPVEVKHDEGAKPPIHATGAGSEGYGWTEAEATASWCAAWNAEHGIGIDRSGR